MTPTAFQVVWRQRAMEPVLLDMVRRYEEHLIRPLVRQMYLEVQFAIAHDEIRQMGKEAMEAVDRILARKP